MARRSAWQEFALTLLWAAEKFMFPSIPKLVESFDTWEIYNGYERPWERLEDQKLIARDERTARRVFKLTTTGRSAVMDVMNVTTAWDRKWDGHWRLVLFDLPQKERRLRMPLWRWLKANRFGYLQGSVWVHPDNATAVNAILRGFRDNAEAFTVMETVSAKQSENVAIVDGAWDFEEIDKRHRAYLDSQVLSARDAARLRPSPQALQLWLRSERIAWRHALQIDPLLPRNLWPRNYQGESVWKTRLQNFVMLAG